MLFRSDFLFSIVVVSVSVGGQRGVEGLDVDAASECFAQDGAANDRVQGVPVVHCVSVVCARQRVVGEAVVAVIC